MRPMLRTELSRLARSSSLEHGVASGAENACRDLAHGVVVFDEQDRPMRCGASDLNRAGIGPSTGRSIRAK